MNKPFSRIVSRAQSMGVYRSMYRPQMPLWRNQIRTKSYQDWRKHPLNNKYIFFDFAGDLERRSPMLIPNICRFLDNYIFRSSPAYATFIVLCAYFWESCMERIADWYWARSNVGRMFTPDVLDKFPPELEEEDDDDEEDEDW